MLKMFALNQEKRKKSYLFRRWFGNSNSSKFGKFSSKHFFNSHSPIIKCE